MQILLTAINSKYIHSNLAVYSIKAYHDEHTNGKGNVSLMEYTINQPVDYCVADIYRRKPQVVAISCYIWNITYVCEAAAQLKKVMPDVKIWLGGPEVSFNAHKLLTDNENIDGIMCGEGEMTFLQLANTDFNVEAYAAQDNQEIYGIVYRSGGNIYSTPQVKALDMDKLPFVYKNLDAFKNKIIYYESSRGCPFGCSYCLSSVDKNVRFRSLSLVFKELQFFLDNKVSQVKFVDRTFNCNHERTVRLLEYIREHDNGVTNFHFEIAADLLNDDEIKILTSLRPGLVQLEIGVQSTNIDTIHHINRIMDFKHLSDVVRKLNMGKNLHLHLDLIA
ncbi:MAG: radical SAM protein, partial [Eubacteriales bacterium]|nr:radical SAM protein [Eubacteriales bacterium]